MSRKMEMFYEKHKWKSPYPHSYQSVRHSFTCLRCSFSLAAVGDLCSSIYDAELQISQNLYNSSTLSSSVAQWLSGIYSWELSGSAARRLVGSAILSHESCQRVIFINANKLSALIYVRCELSDVSIMAIKARKSNKWICLNSTCIHSQNIHTLSHRKCFFVYFWLWCTLVASLIFNTYSLLV